MALQKELKLVVGVYSSLSLLFFLNHTQVAAMIMSSKINIKISPIPILIITPHYFSYKPNKESGTYLIYKIWVINIKHIDLTQ